MKPGPKRQIVKEEEFGIPGRTGISLGWLNSQAHVWNMVLHDLRDGVPGFIAKIAKSGPGKRRLAPEMDYLAFHDVLAQAEQQRRGLSRAHARKIELLRVAIIAPKRTLDARELVKGKRDWMLTPPRYPIPEIWERLKKARSICDVQRLARDIHVRYRTISVAQWEPFHNHAADFLRAKKLHNYPRSVRPGSDEKRIHFFAKILSGFMQNIAPATATKRLARLSLPNKRELRRAFEEHAMWYSMPKYRQGKMKRLIAVERERGSVKWSNVYQDETDRIWREPREAL
jgi:hypothetical protein